MDNGAPPGKKLALPLPDSYEIGFGKPPVATRFKPGQSGNLNGRPKGKQNKLPEMSEERLKTIILQEAYRDVPIMERGRAKKISMIEANIRALAVSGAKGNNRAANIFASSVLKIEEDRKTLAAEYFGSAIDYKQRWGAELARRKRLGLDLPDPIPHPDDLVLDRQKGLVHIRGPITKEDQELWEFGESIIEIMQESTTALKAKLETETDEGIRGNLQREIKANEARLKQLLRLFGPPEFRRTNRSIFEMEDEFDLDLTSYKLQSESEG